MVLFGVAVVVVFVFEGAASVVVGETLVVDDALVAISAVGVGSEDDSEPHETAAPTREIAKLAVKSRCRIAIT